MRSMLVVEILFYDYTLFDVKNILSFLTIELATFVPGKINSKFVQIFEGKPENEQNRGKSEI